MVEIDIDTDSSSPHHANTTSSAEVFPTPPRENHTHLTGYNGGRNSTVPRRMTDMQRAASTPPEINREVARPTLSRSKENNIDQITTLRRSFDRQQLSKKKSQYYSDAFAYRESNNSARERVHRDSLVIADVKISKAIHSEPEFLLDLSFRLSEVYQRPESNIMATVTPQVHMIVGGTREPAYHITIYALQSEIAPTKNKRSTYLLQEFMHDMLKIAPKRGVIQFEGVADANLATNGVTVLQEIEEKEQLQSGEENGVLRAISRQSRRGKNYLSERAKTPLPFRSMTPSHLRASTRETVRSSPTDTIEPDKKRLRHRKSLLSFFRKASSA